MPSWDIFKVPICAFRPLKAQLYWWAPLVWPQSSWTYSMIHLDRNILGPETNVQTTSRKPKNLDKFPRLKIIRFTKCHSFLLILILVMFCIILDKNGSVSCSIHQTDTFSVSVSISRNPLFYRNIFVLTGYGFQYFTTCLISVGKQNKWENNFFMVDVINIYVKWNCRRQPPWKTTFIEDEFQ